MLIIGAGWSGGLAAVTGGVPPAGGCPRIQVPQAIENPAPEFMKGGAAPYNPEFFQGARANTQVLRRLDRGKKIGVCHLYPPSVAADCRVVLEETMAQHTAAFQYLPGGVL